MAKKFQIDYDMLGIIAWLSTRLVPSWLEDMCVSIPQKKWEEYLAGRAFDALKPSLRNLLYAFVDGKITLTDNERRALIDCGFLCGGKLPQAITNRVKFYLDNDVIHVDDEYISKLERL